MENRWLKGTDLGLGFQLVSITGQMADNEKFCRILGLKIRKWRLGVLQDITDNLFQKI